MAKAQAQATFGSILDRAPTEFERPKPLPVGSYTCVVKGLPRHDVSSKKKTEFVEFTLQPLSAGEDVDQDELKAMGGYANKTIRATFYTTEDATWRLRKFLEDLGIEEGDSLRAMIDETPNKQIIAYIKHRASEDGQAVFAELGGTAAVE